MFSLQWSEYSLRSFFRATPTLRHIKGYKYYWKVDGYFGNENNALIKLINDVERAVSRTSEKINMKYSVWK